MSDTSTTPSTNTQSPQGQAITSNTAGKTPKEWISHMADAIWALHRPGDDEANDAFKNHRIYITAKALAQYCGLDEPLVLAILHHGQKIHPTSEKVDMLRTIAPYEDHQHKQADQDTPYPYEQVAWLDDTERTKRITAAKAALTEDDNADDAT